MTGNWLITILIIWPIIVNAQPGNSFVWAGIDWKVNDLDGVLFWTGIILSLILAAGTIIETKEKEKKKKYGKENQERDLR
jgi:hypothetical protein